MTIRLSSSALALSAGLISSAVFAGDEPVYKAAPDWVETVDLEEIEYDPSNSQIVYDAQIRIEEGLHWQYQDSVFRIDSLQDLSNVGNLQAQWFPDKGDFIVHELAILRDGQSIDLVEAGEKFEVLRREQQLEQRILDGSLTATLSVPGLQVGDKLRFRYSVTTSDQALGDEVQSLSYLYREPTKVADYARIMASWPKDLDVSYQAGPNVDPPLVTETSGYNFVQILLPLKEADPIPRDAPLRYRQNAMLQIGTFDDWAEVSSTMQPFYVVGDAIADIPDLMQRVETIREDYDNDLDRAVAALELVQEDIRYLLNGLDGGNYIPQSVAETWDKKYGDCKAKTVILLEILDYLGIEAEPVLASVSAGNAVPTSLPLPGAFDHVLVRANIDGQAYYLDGTSLGANKKIVGNVPPFEYVLPIRKSGAQLEPIKQELPRYPDMNFEVIADASAGGDLPTLATMKVNLVGPMAAQMNAAATKLTDANKKAMSRQFGDEMKMLNFDILEGDDDSEASIVMTGILGPIYEVDGTKAELGVGGVADKMTFAPDRSRREWRDIPVAAGAPSRMTTLVDFKLPDEPAPFMIKGNASVEHTIGRSVYSRTVTLTDGRLKATESNVSMGGEIASEEFAATRKAAAELARDDTKIIVPDGWQRIWRFAESSDRSALAPLEEAFAKLIANDPDEADPYLERASFRFDTYDFAGSLEDMNQVINLEGTAEFYSQRSGVHAKLLDPQAELADLQEAYELDPTAWRAMSYAAKMAELGDIDAARELLDYQTGDEEVMQSLAITLAEIDALDGDKASGFERINELALDKPNDDELLNTKCWFMGTWQVELEQGEEVCTRAVELSGKSASRIDSRALMYYRLGMYDKALADANSALDIAPSQTATVLLKGFIRLAQGDSGGQADIDSALARSPDIKASYERWGFKFD